MEKEHGKDGGEKCYWAGWKGDFSTELYLAVAEAPAKVPDGGFLQEREVRKSRPWSNNLYQALLF